MAARIFSEEQLERLRSFPDVGRDDLIRYFTLAQADVALWIRDPAGRLGLSVQLCTLPWQGFVPDEVLSAPPVAVARLDERLGLDLGRWRGTGAVRTPCGPCFPLQQTAMSSARLARRGPGFFRSAPADLSSS